MKHIFSCLVLLVKLCCTVKLWMTSSFAFLCQLIFYWKRLFSSFPLFLENIVVFTCCNHSCKHKINKLNIYESLLHIAFPVNNILEYFDSLILNGTWKNQLKNQNKLKLLSPMTAVTQALAITTISSTRTHNKAHRHDQFKRVFVHPNGWLILLNHPVEHCNLAPLYPWCSTIRIPSLCLADRCLLTVFPI